MDCQDGNVAIEIARANGQSLRAMTPVAQYLRVSTGLQPTSLSVQAQAIAAYAIMNGLEIVRTYVDEACSGLNANGRDALQALIRDILGGSPGFKVVLVYDVSRWGRFQDTDEAAHYEFLCKAAGVPVRYCAECFSHDSGPYMALVKSVKRIMAAEFSRDLSVKTAEAHWRWALEGFRQGGSAGFGLRRMLVDTRRGPCGVLQHNERKFDVLKRVVLVPGPEKEVRLVRWIFKQIGDGRRTLGAIAHELNARGVVCAGGRRWTDYRVRGLVENEKYLGTLVHGRTSIRLKGPLTFRPPEIWLKVPNAFAPVVSREEFDRAQSAMASWTSRITPERALERLKELLKRHGRVTTGLIDRTPGIPGSAYYRRRYGSLLNAYAAIGWKPPGNYDALKEHAQQLRCGRDFREKLLRALHDESVEARYDSPAVLTIRGLLRVAVVTAFHQLKGGRDVWQFGTTRFAFLSSYVLVARLKPQYQGVEDYWLVDSSRTWSYCGGAHPPVPKHHHWRSFNKLVGDIASERASAGGQGDPTGGTGIGSRWMP